MVCRLLSMWVGGVEGGVLGKGCWVLIRDRLSEFFFFIVLDLGWDRDDVILVLVFWGFRDGDDVYG